MGTQDNTTDLLRCLDSNDEGCDKLGFSLGPEFQFQAERAQSNSLFRELGTSKDLQRKTPGFFIPQAELFNSDGTLVEREVNFGATLNRNELNNATFDFDAGIAFNVNGAQTVAVDNGGIDPEGTQNQGLVQNLLDQQRLSDQAVRIEGGNKAFPYINPLASTNFASLDPINPLGTIDNGDGFLYDPKLLDDEGIIYLRQYLSFDDETTGAVWRFQYAPEISYSRSSTFQEDPTWGTNVQPAHFNNTSGKKVQIQGAILEGMTIGRTVTGAVQALETLMSVVNPDNEEQVAPYAYRLIIGERTLTEPVSQRHAPFVIEQIQVQEKLYDTQGEVLYYKVDISLKEVPYYQINDGRKLLLVTQNERTVAQRNCDEISATLATLSEEALLREAENTKELLDTIKRGTNSINGVTPAASSETKFQAAKEVLRTASDKFLTNCKADSDAYSEFLRNIKAYEDAKCTTSKNLKGFDAIERQFAYKAGVYEVLMGRPSESRQGFLTLTVFDENGETVPARQRLKQIAKKGALPIDAEGLPNGAQEAVDFLNIINPSERAKIITQSQFRTISNLLAGDKNKLKSCPHIYCVDEDIQGNISEDNLGYIAQISENIVNNPGTFAELFGNSDAARRDAYLELFPKGNSNANNAQLAFFFNRLQGPNRNNVCGKKNDDFAGGTRIGLLNNGEVLKKHSNFLNPITKDRRRNFLENVTSPLVNDNGKFARDPYAQAGYCYNLGATIINESVKVAKGNRSARCNINSHISKTSKIYLDFVNRGGAIYKAIQRASDIPFGQLNQSVSSENVCDEFAASNGYDSNKFRACLGAYSVAEAIKTIIEIQSPYQTIEDPIPDVTLKTRRLN